MRFYVNAIENTINGENRTQPKAYDNLDSAVAEYHRVMAQDMKSEQVLGCQILVWNSAGGIHVNDTWGVMVNPPAPPTPEEPVEEDVPTE